MAVGNVAHDTGLAACIQQRIVAELSRMIVGNITHVADCATCIE